MSAYLRYTIRREDVPIQGEPLATTFYEPEKSRADVVLVHGFTGSKEDFVVVAGLLAESGFRVLTFDNRGQHESSHSLRHDAYSLESLGRDNVEISQHFNLNKPHILGHSFGGLITQQAVLLAPDYWSSFTLFCSGPGGQSGWMNDPQYQNLTNQTKAQIWQEILAPQREGDPRIDLLKKRWLASDAVATLAYREHLLNQPSQITALSKLNIPSHVVYGEKDDRWSPKIQNEMARELQSQVTILPNCGHNPNEENPQLTTQKLSAYWDQLTYF